MASIVDVKSRRGFKRGQYVTVKETGQRLWVCDISPIREDFLVCLSDEKKMFWLRPKEVVRVK